MFLNFWRITTLIPTKGCTWVKLAQTINPNSMVGLQMGLVGMLLKVSIMIVLSVLGLAGNQCLLAPEIN